MALRTIVLAFGWALLTSSFAQSLEIPTHIRRLVEARDYAAAENAIAAELSRTPAWDGGHLLLGQIYSQQGRYDLAERSAAEAVRIRESLDGFMILAVATMRLNRLNDSIGWLEKAVRIRPDHAGIYKILGLDYALGGTLKESEAAFRKAAALQPGDWETQYFHGRALFELGRIREAVECLRRAADLNTASPKAWTALGQAQERSGDIPEAERSYRTAVAACGSGRECAWPLLQLGFLFATRKTPDEATSFFRKAVEARPDWARPHFHLGKSLAAAGDLRAARAELERAVALDDSRSEYHYQLAQVYRRMGEAEKAGAQFAKFRALADFESHGKPAPEFAQP